jgi:hypothetical protein
MGLSRLEIGFLKRALAAGVIPSGGDLLELGESVVIPAADPLELLEMIRNEIPELRYVEAQKRIVAAATAKANYQIHHAPARGLYHAIFEPRSYVAVDVDLGPGRICANLNAPVVLHKQFDCTINNGTSEHVFNQANVFEFMHYHTRVGGIMVHWTPCLGWINHGLYNVQPGFFFDLAAANGYEIRHIELAHPDAGRSLQSGGGFADAVAAQPALANSQICTVLRKVKDESFIPPIQGMYALHLPGLQLAKRLHEPIMGRRPNLALHKPALQSSTSLWSWHDDPAEDAGGVNNGIVTGYYSCHTDMELTPWWRVDLEHEQAISEIVVYNRIDHPAMAARAAKLTIAISHDGINWHDMYTRTEDKGFGGADGIPLRVLLPEPTRTRYVRIMLPGRTILNLDEVEIY